MATKRSKKTFCYKVFGLTISSEIELPELFAASGTPDVFIRRATIPADYKTKSTLPSFWLPTPDYFLLSLEGIGSYLVKDGQTIDIEPAPDHAPSELRLFILGSCMGVLLHQRGILPMHASGIATEHGCVMFAGDTGAGKSTTLTAFQQRGYKIISDDICAIALNDEGIPVVYPSYPQIKIKDDAADGLNIETAELERIRADLDKYKLMVQGNFQTESLPLHKIYFLKTGTSAQITFQPLHGQEKIFLLIQNTYRSQLLDGLGKSQQHFLLCKTLSRNLNTVALERQKDLAQIDHFIKAIEADFNGV